MNDNNINPINNEQNIPNQPTPAIQPTAAPVDPTPMAAAPTEPTAPSAPQPVEEPINVPNEQINSVKPKGGFNLVVIVIIAIVVIIGGVFAYKKLANNTSTNKTSSKEQSSYKKIYEKQKIGIQSPIYYNDSNYQTKLGVLFAGTYTIEVYDEKIGDITDINNAYFNQIYAEIASAYSNTCEDYIKSLGSDITIADIQSKTNSFDFIKAINNYLKSYNSQYKITDLKFSIIELDDTSKRRISELVGGQLTNPQTENESSTQALVNSFEAEIRLYTKEEGGLHTPAFVGATWSYKIDGSSEILSGEVSEVKDETMMMPGESYNITAKVTEADLKLYDTFKIIIGDREIGEGKITKVY